MKSILEFIIEDEEKLIALVQPEATFVEETLEEEYYYGAATNDYYWYLQTLWRKRVACRLLSHPASST